jgi:hypothetical protein
MRVVVILNPSEKILRHYIKVGHSHFLQNIFKSIILDLSSLHDAV